MAGGCEEDSDPNSVIYLCEEENNPQNQEKKERCATAAYFSRDRSTTEFKNYPLKKN